MTGAVSFWITSYFFGYFPPSLAPPRYLLDPLTALDAEMGAQKQEKFAVVMLLDALDEASDGIRGFEAVASFVARE